MTRGNSQIYSFLKGKCGTELEKFTTKFLKGKITYVLHIRAEINCFKNQVCFLETICSQ